MERQFFGRSPALSLVIASAFWGIGTVLSKALLGSVPPILFLVIQLAPSVVVLWLLALLRKARAPRRNGLLPVLLLGWLNPGLSYTFSMLGLARTTASVATLVWAAEPALIVVLAGLLLRERVTPGLIALTATAALGVLLASGAANFADTISANAYGAAVILAGVLCCALYTVFSRRIVREMDPLFIVAMQQSVGLAWALSIWPIEWHSNGTNQLLSLSAKELLGALISGLMYYAIAYWFYLDGLRSMPASKAGNFLNLIPMFGIAVAYALLGERLTAAQWAGTVLILISIFIIQTLASSSNAGVAEKSA
jgi:drug/metabolite transporter (DMT)-like permease